MTQLCACGCGLPTSLITRSNKYDGSVAGAYRRYRVGHGNRKPKPTVEFLRQSTTVNVQTGCWEWVGRLAATGYGMLCVGRKGAGAHRVMYKLTHGDIPVGHQIRHKCDNRKCINPDHLETGTIADNMRDKAERGRATRGSSHHSSKLTEDQARLIKHSSEGPAALARLFGVSERAITFIKSGRNWKHIT